MVQEDEEGAREVLQSERDWRSLLDNQVEFIDGNFIVNFFMEVDEATFGKQRNLASGFH